MLGWIAMLIVLATISGVLGFAGLATPAAGLAHDLFAVFLLLLVVSIAFSAMRRR